MRVCDVNMKATTTIATTTAITILFVLFYTYVFFIKKKQSEPNRKARPIWFTQQSIFIIQMTALLLLTPLLPPPVLPYMKGMAARIGPMSVFCRFSSSS
mmetsp:Transcript_33978/g.55384  ORF Transcript_33978/g.55384 Transcript_33978/m.55384 type:complete len:99 (-) Transcript_33978:1865-2161(-)